VVRPISGGKARSALARSVRWMRRRIAKRRYQRLHEDRLRDYEWALLNIKTLGYELARLLTNCQPRPVPTEAPTTALRAKLCTQSDMESAWVSFWCAEVGVGPVYHRKIWELCYIAQVLHSAGMLTAGRSGIGFGCGREPLPSLFAKYGCEVLATDLPRNTAAARGWAGQLATGLIDVRRPEICSDQQKLDNIRFRYLDMNKIPEDLYGAFDFCWSSCALEHLGSLAQGAEFIEASLRVLKPQGMAVHTTEFNLSESGETLDGWDPVLFQRRHLTELADRLSAAGHTVAELDFEAGDGVLDRFVDLPPWDTDAGRWSMPPAHLKVSISGYRCTSFGLFIRAAPETPPPIR